MTPEDVQRRYADEVATMDLDADDEERAHIAEDKLALDVLHAIDHPLATAFVEAYDRHHDEHEPARWCG